MLKFQNNYTTILSNFEDFILTASGQPHEKNQEYGTMVKKEVFAIKEYFEEIQDTRQQWKVKYNLVETIVMTIIAVAAGAEYWNEIAMYCKNKEEMLRDKFGIKLENGIPTDNTFRRIFSIINLYELEKCFINWVSSVNEIVQNERISVDGKTLRGSRKDKHNVIHMVSAWVNKTGIVLGQLRVDDKSNEIPAVPELLNLIDVSGCTITSDAMSCQKKTGKKIIDKKCDYVICPKAIKKHCMMM